MIDINKVILIGRLARNPDIRYSNQGDRQLAIARYSLAVDRRKTRNNEDPGADFISCVAFDRQAEFVERFLKKGTKIAVVGHIQTGSYTNQEGQKVYTTDVIVTEHEFCERKASQDNSSPEHVKEDDNGFMNVPDNVDDGMLPFN